MEWLRTNWFWIAVVVFFIWMHTKMHGGHGHGHGTAGGHGAAGGHGGCCGGHAHGDEGEEAHESHRSSDMEIHS